MKPSSERSALSLKKGEIVRIELWGTISRTPIETLIGEYVGAWKVAGVPALLFKDIADGYSIFIFRSLSGTWVWGLRREPVTLSQEDAKLI